MLFIILYLVTNPPSSPVVPQGPASRMRWLRSNIQHTICRGHRVEGHTKTTASEAHRGGDGVCTAIIRLRGGQLAACAGRSRAATHQTRSTRAPRITYHRRDIMVDAHYAMGEQCVNEAVAFAVAARMVEPGAHHHASSQNSSKTSSFATALTAFACAWVALTTSSKR